MRGKYKTKPVNKHLLAGGLITLSLITFGIATKVMAHGNHNQGKTAVNAEFVVLQVTKQGPQIKRIDTNGHEQVLYSVPKGDRLYQVQHAPNKPQLIISYQQKHSSLQGIWTLDYSEKENNQSFSLSPVLVDKDPKTYFFDPLFGTNENGLYFVSAQIDEQTKRASKDLALKFYNTETRHQKLIAKNASHPSISGSGRFLSWIERHDNFGEVKVLKTGTEEVQTYRVTNSKTVVRFSKVNEQLNTLFFFSNREKLLAASMSTNRFSLSDFLLPTAHAHSGHKHADSFGWQISLDTSDLESSKQNWKVSDIRAFDISADGKHAAWLNSDGLSIVDVVTGKPLKTIKNPNYWKLVYLNSKY